MCGFVFQRGKTFWPGYAPRTESRQQRCFPWWSGSPRALRPSRGSSFARRGRRQAPAARSTSSTTCATSPRSVWVLSLSRWTSSCLRFPHQGFLRCFVALYLLRCPMQKKIVHRDRTMQKNDWDRLPMRVKKATCVGFEAGVKKALWAHAIVRRRMNYFFARGPNLLGLSARIAITAQCVSVCPCKCCSIGGRGAYLERFNISGGITLLS